MKQWAEVTDLVVVLQPRRSRQHGNAAVLIHPNEHEFNCRAEHKLASMSVVLPSALIQQLALQVSNFTTICLFTSKGCHQVCNPQRQLRVVLDSNTAYQVNIKYFAINFRMERLTDGDKYNTD